MHSPFKRVILQEIFVENEVLENTKIKEVLNKTPLNQIIHNFLHIEYFTPDDVRDEIRDQYLKTINPYYWYMTIPEIKRFENYIVGQTFDQPQMEIWFIQTYQRGTGHCLLSEPSIRSMINEFSHSPNRVYVRNLAYRIMRKVVEYTEHVFGFYQFLLKRFEKTSNNRQLFLSIIDKGYLLDNTLKINPDGSIMIQFRPDPTYCYENKDITKNIYHESDGYSWESQ